MGGRISKDRIFREGDFRGGRDLMDSFEMVFGLLGLSGLGMVWRYARWERVGDDARIEWRD